MVPPCGAPRIVESRSIGNTAKAIVIGLELSAELLGTPASE